MVPLGEQNATSLPSGTYRLAFEMYWQRWETLDAPDSVSRYEQTATLVLTL